MNEDVTQHESEEVAFFLEWESKDLADHLWDLRAKRPEGKPHRVALHRKDREEILAKTANRCHICGGNIDPHSYWEADHVLCCAQGGSNTASPTSPAICVICAICGKALRGLLSASGPQR